MVLCFAPMTPSLVGSGEVGRGVPSLGRVWARCGKAPRAGAGQGAVGCARPLVGCGMARRGSEGPMNRSKDMVKEQKVIHIGEVSNGAAEAIEASEPYAVSVTITGSSDIFFHRWNCESVEAKAKASKNSKAKKTDDVESYVYRDDKGEICIPGEYLRQAIINAAKFRQDPRSPRKSAMDLYKAAIICETQLASLGVKDWDYEDRRRVVIQRNGITRTRPAMRSGWCATFEISVILPEYISQTDLSEVITNAGRLIGIGDFRPTYGRFVVSHFRRG